MWLGQSVISVLPLRAEGIENGPRRKTIARDRSASSPLSQSSGACPASGINREFMCDL
jgi:hypothetical protein